jgi:hypothetical protein
MAAVETILALAYTPPSLNRITGGSGWTWRGEKAALQRDLETLLMAERIPRPVEHVAASATLAFPVARRRDEGNYRALIEKALGDALTSGGWLADDTPQHFQFGAVTFTRGHAATLIAVLWTES